MAPAADQSVHGNADEIIPSLIDRGNDSSDISGNFDCSICLEESQAPVVTMCGHLFCWPCIHQWITIHSALEQCPVCKACIKDKIIPLYGRGKTDFTSPGLEKVHRSGRPHVTSLYNQHMNPSADLSGLQNAGFQYVGQQSYGFVAQENYGPQGAYFTSSAITFGLFPALFGVYGSTVTHQNGGRPSRSSSSSLAMRGRAIDTFLFQRVQPDREHRFILCGFLVLLAGFAISCLLLF